MVVVVAGAALSTSRSGEPRSQSLGGTTAPSVTTTAAPPPPPVGSVSLVEKGFSIGTPHPDLVAAPPAAYVGFIVENTSDQIAMGTPITYHYVDAAGNVIRSYYADIQVAAIGPGQRFAWGRVDRLEPHPPVDMVVADVVVEVGEPGRWVAPSSLSPEEREQTTLGGYVSPEDLEELARVTVDDVAMSYDGEAALTVTFTASSDSREELSGTVGLILRNRAGEIVTGWVSDVDLVPGTTSVEVEIEIFDHEPGDHGRLAELDPGQTEFYFAVL